MNKQTSLKWLAGLLVVAFATRLIFVTVVDSHRSLHGGDGPFYLTVAQNVANGYGLSSGQLATYKVDPVITTGPLYPLYLTVFYVLGGGYRTHPIIDPPVPFSTGDPWVMAARVGQALIGALTVAAVYALARQLPLPARLGGPGWNARAALIAAGIMAVDLRFIVEAGAVYTETLFTFFLVAALALYLAAPRRSDKRWYAAAWLVLGLAVMTRPSALVLFPPLLLHVWISQPRARAVEQTIILAGMLALVLTPWIVRNYLAFGKLTLFGDTALSHFWLGAIRNGEWQGFEDFVQQQIAIANGDYNKPPYLQAALIAIAQHPLRFAQLVGLKLARAYIQPFGTVFFAGPSLKTYALDVLARRMNPIALLGDATFCPKLIIYVLHFGTITLGLSGMWRMRRRWRETLPLILVIAVTSGVYALLTIIPRYLFPIMPFFSVFAAETIVGLWPWRRPAPVSEAALPPASFSRATPLPGSGEDALSRVRGG